MNTRPSILSAIVAAALASTLPFTCAMGQTAMLPAPGFHHLHLNSVDPDAAIDFYTRQFASTRKTTWGGLPALQSPNNVLILFTKVDKPPPTSPQTAIWHFGWYVADVRTSRDGYLRRSDVELLPLYTTEDGGSVLISTDTWPGRDGVLGLTRAQIADATRNGVQPTRRGGFAYMRGPDNAIVEYMQDPTAEPHEPRALYSWAAVLRPALVPEAPRRHRAAAAPRHTAKHHAAKQRAAGHRGELQS